MYFGMYALIGIITLIVQIFALVRLKKEKVAKYWNLFIGVTGASLIFVGIAYAVFANNAVGLSGAVGCWILCGASLICNVILLIIGAVMKRSIKSQRIKLNKNVFITGSATLLLSVALILGLPAAISGANTNLEREKVISYLTDRYGDGDYEIVNTYVRYENVGMWDKTANGHIYEVKSNYMDEPFMVVTLKDSGGIDSDYFLPVYFSRQNNLSYKLGYSESSNSLYCDFTRFNEYVEAVAQEEYGEDLYSSDATEIYNSYIASWNSETGIEYDENYYIVPENDGKIPSIDEVVEGLVTLKTE